MENKKTFKDYLKAFFFSFVWLMVLVFVLDIVSKWLVQIYVGTGNTLVVIPNFFNIICTHNTGAAFSFGAVDDGSTIIWRIIFIMLSAIVGAVLIGYYIKNYSKLRTWYKVSLALIIGGDFGNLIDRAFYWEGTVGFNGVIDWLSFYLFGSKTPFATFNIADAALVVGIFLLIILLLIDVAKESFARKTDKKFDVPVVDTTKVENKPNPDATEVKCEVVEENKEEK